MIKLAVCGAHMSGLPLNHQLTELGASLYKKTKTTKSYRLYEVPNKVPARPGLTYDKTSNMAIELEVWEIAMEKFGEFMVQIASPLCIGTVFLEDGSSAYGFLCENYALLDAEEITKYGGWKTYLSK